MSEDGGDCAGEWGVGPGGDLGDEEDGKEAFADVGGEGDGAEFFAEYAEGVGGADVFGAVFADVDFADGFTEPVSGGDCAGEVGEDDGE